MCFRSDDLASNLASFVTLSKSIEPHWASVFPVCKMEMQWHLSHKIAVRLNETVVEKAEYRAWPTVSSQEA